MAKKAEQGKNDKIEKWQVLSTNNMLIKYLKSVKLWDL